MRILSAFDIGLFEANFVYLSKLESDSENLTFRVKVFLLYLQVTTVNYLGGLFPRVEVLLFYLNTFGNIFFFSFLRWPVRPLWKVLKHF